MRRRALPAFLLLLVSAAASPALAAGNVVISQVYGGGGNTGATWKNDFIELFNRGSAPVVIDGWSVQYGSSGGTTWTNKTNLSGTIQPGQYYLVQEAAGAGGTQALPAPDATGSIAMSATGGKVALVNNQTALSCVAACVPNSAVVDFVGYDGANNFEGAPTPSLTNTTAALRKSAGCTDTDNNAADFTVGAPTPRNSASPGHTCSNILAAGAATPSSLQAGGSTLLTVTVTPGSDPVSTGITVQADLSAFGGSATQAFADDGVTGGDAASGDNVFSFTLVVPTGTAPGTTNLPASALDAQGRTAPASIGVTVLPPPPPMREIHEIQGPGLRSPFDGQAVSTHGIVTARKSNGFFLQASDGEADADPATSEGIFVFTSSAPPAIAAVGNRVTVSGKVSEFVPPSDPVSPPMTEISGGPAVTLDSTGNPLPAPVTIVAADTDPSGTAEQLERLEGMRVRVDSMTVVAPTQGNVSEANATATTTGLFFGVVTGVERPRREAGISIFETPPAGSPAGIPRFDENPERLRVDSDGQTGAAALEVTSGAILTDLVGVLDFAFRTSTILPDPGTPPVITGLSAARAVRTPAGDEFTVGSFNLERFYDTVNDAGISDVALTPAAYARRLVKASLAIRNVMGAPDVLGVEEVENLAVLQTLADQLNADAVSAGQPDPGYRAYLLEGNDIGGIDAGALVRARVHVLDFFQDGHDATYINPLSGEPEILFDRPPLVVRVSIEAPGGAASFPVTVVVNHLRSLSGMEDPVDGARIRAKRAAEAEYVAQLIQDRQAADPREALVTVGDFNAFSVNDGYVDVIGTIKGTPTPADQVVLASPDLVNPDLLDLIDLMPPSEAYSYSFDGNAQALDHVIVNQALLGKVRGIEVARNDADFPETFRSDGARPERISDHDMPVGYFRFPKADVTLTKTASSGSPLSGSALTYALGVANQGPDEAVDVTVTDALPPGLAFEAVSAAGWDCTTPAVGETGAVTCTRASLDASAAAPLWISARLACALPDGATLTNTAAATTRTTDPDASNDSGAAAVRVTNPPPAVGPVQPDHALLWPPNHKMIAVALDYGVADNCDPNPTCALSVSSNEPVNGSGDGNTSTDWQVVDAHHVLLRAERAGTGSGRLYTVTAACTDSAGNVGRASATVEVPKSGR